MTSLDTDNYQLLLQMNQLSREAAKLPEEKNNSAHSVPFSNYVKDAMQTVSNQQNDADTLSAKFAKEDPSVSLSQTMIQMQKAEISLSALVAVRNKVIDGYKTVMNMSL